MFLEFLAAAQGVISLINGASSLFDSGKLDVIQKEADKVKLQGFQNDLTGAIHQADVAISAGTEQRDVYQGVLDAMKAGSLSSMMGDVIKEGGKYGTAMSEFTPSGANGLDLAKARDFYREIADVYTSYSGQAIAMDQVDVEGSTAGNVLERGRDYVIDYAGTTAQNLSNVKAALTNLTDSKVLYQNALDAVNNKLLNTTGTNDGTWLRGDTNKDGVVSLDEAILQGIVDVGGTIGNAVRDIKKAGDSIGNFFEGVGNGVVDFFTPKPRTVTTPSAEAAETKTKSASGMRVEVNEKIKAEVASRTWRGITFSSVEEMEDLKKTFGRN